MYSRRELIKITATAAIAAPFIMNSSVISASRPAIPEYRAPYRFPKEYL